MMKKFLEQRRKRMKGGSHDDTLRTQSSQPLFCKSRYQYLINIIFPGTNNLGDPSEDRTYEARISLLGNKLTKMILCTVMVWINFEILTTSVAFLARSLHIDYVSVSFSNDSHTLRYKCFPTHMFTWLSFTRSCERRFIVHSVTSYSQPLQAHSYSFAIYMTNIQWNFIL